jgi:CDP-4-dehydro-6-deoxyglucose reductase
MDEVNLSPEQSVRVTHHEITLFPSGTKFITRENETLLEAATRGGLLLPNQCKAGHCGACKARVLEGNTLFEPADAPALSRDEADNGIRLTCCTRAMSPIRLECAEIAHFPGIEVRKLPVRISTLEKMAPDVMRVRLQPPSGQQFEYLPGQYVDVLLPGSRRRSYSLATMPGDAMLELHVRHLPGGLFTDQLFSKLKVRDVLRIEGPFGTFGMRTSGHAPAILLASGTGLAPIRALVQQLLAEDSPRSMTLYWGGRTLADLYLHEECLQWVEAMRGRLSYVPVLSNAIRQDQWIGRTGFVHRSVMEDHPDLSKHEVYACGAPRMIEAARQNFATDCYMRPTAFFADAFVATQDS